MEAETHWQQLLASKCPRDYKGKDGEVRLKILVEEFELLGNRKIEGSELRAGYKSQKRPKADQVDAQKPQLGSRHEDFDSGFFDDGTGDGLQHVPGLAVKNNLSKPVMPSSVSSGVGKVTPGRRTRGDLSDDGGSPAQTARGNAGKLAKLRDRESKLNKLRNDLTDVLVELEAVARGFIQSASTHLSMLSDDER
eukprot:2540635-Lingulodinium_polyedra.AAC.1